MRALVVGDNATDVFVNVDTPRLAPEGPWPAVIPHSTTSNPGMAGNVAENLKSLAPHLDVVTLFPENPSIKTRYVDRKTNHCFLRVDNDVHPEPLAGADWLSSIKMCPDIVVASDYNKGFLTPGKMHMISMFCWNNDIPLFADSKALLGDWSRKITFVKINQIEFDNQLRAGISPWKECVNLIVTRGGDGLDLYDQTGAIVHHENSHGGEVIDLAGAGDTTLAALIVGWAETRDIKNAMGFAAKAAGIAVSKRGVVAVKREEVV